VSPGCPFRQLPPRLQAFVQPIAAPLAAALVGNDEPRGARIARAAPPRRGAAPRAAAKRRERSRRRHRPRPRDRDTGEAHSPEFSARCRGKGARTVALPDRAAARRPSLSPDALPLPVRVRPNRCTPAFHRHRGRFFAFIAGERRWTGGPSQGPGSTSLCLTLPTACPTAIFGRFWRPPKTRKAAL